MEDENVVSDELAAATLEASKADAAEFEASQADESVERENEFTREVDFEATGDDQFGTVAVQAPGTDKAVVKQVPNASVLDRKDKGISIETQVRVAD